MKQNKKGKPALPAGRYLKYAIGEIILVVIGILIAVSINNWSETNKQKQELENIYTNVLEDLKTDIAHVDAMIKGYKSKDSLFKKVMDGSMTKENYDDCLACTKIITGYPDLAINKRGYNLLSKYNNNSTASQDSLQIEIIQFYTKQLVNLHANDDIISEDVKSNYIDWKNNYTWYADYINNRNLDGFIDYALNDPDYKNRVANFYFLHFKIYVSILGRFNENAKSLVDKIKEEVDKQHFDS